MIRPKSEEGHITRKEGDLFLVRKLLMEPTQTIN